MRTLHGCQTRGLRHLLLHQFANALTLAARKHFCPPAMEEEPENQKRNDKHPGEIVVNQFIEHRRPELLGRSHANRFKQRVHGLVVRRNRPAGTALGGRHRQERKRRAPRGLGRNQLR